MSPREAGRVPPGRRAVSPREAGLAARGAAAGGCRYERRPTGSLGAAAAAGQGGGEAVRPSGGRPQPAVGSLSAMNANASSWPRA